MQLDIKYSSALVIAPAVLGMAVGSVVLSNFGQKVKSRIFINIGLIGFGVTFLILALLGGDNLAFRVRLLSLFFIFLLGVENALVTIPVTTDFQKNTPEEFRGRAYGLLSTFISGISALPVLLSGAIGDIFGVRTVLSTLGIVVLGFGLYRLRPKKV
jgi:DHA3 family macrolide efflux protein-like MFS transporter